MKFPIWIVVALLTLAYAAATPPFQGPDEVGHFWRAYSIARGAIVPAREHGKPVADIPRGARDLVATLWVATAGQSGDAAKVRTERIRNAMRVERGDEVVRVVAPAFYTPVPYTAQALACFIGDRLALRPLFTFYLGRLCNAALALALFVIAARIAKRRWVFIAIALLPMLLFLCGTFSADATTCGLAFVVTALALDDRRFGAFAACALLLALCKPVYLLLPLVRVFRLPRVRVAVLAVAIAAGAWLSWANAQRNFYAMRTDVPLSSSAQMTNVRLAPLHFLRITVDDYRKNGLAYLEQFAGRLGWLDVPLPRLMIVATLILLALIGLATERIAMRERLIAIAILIASMLAISLSQYLAWTPVGADWIEGIQGRYFLPLGPLVLLILSAGLRQEKVVRATYAAIAIALNIAALAAIVMRYY